MLNVRDTRVQIQVGEANGGAEESTIGRFVYHMGRPAQQQAISTTSSLASCLRTKVRISSDEKHEGM